MIPQEFTPKSSNHVAVIHVTEAKWFLPLLEREGIPFALSEDRLHPRDGYVWALEGGNGQLVNIDLFVEEEFHQQFKELYEEHFKTQSDAELSKFGIRQAMSVTALLVLALVVIIVIDICFTSRLAYYFEVPSFFIYQAYVLLAFIGVTVSYLDRIYRLLLRRKDV